MPHVEGSCSLKLRTFEDVKDFLATVAPDATDTRKWQAVRTATRNLLRQYGISNASQWEIIVLPHQATWRMGDADYRQRRIRFAKKVVHNFWINDLASIILHEVAHAVVAHELCARGDYSGGGHGPMWKGQMAVMGIKQNNRFHSLEASRKGVA